MLLPSLSSLLAARVADALPDHDFDPRVRRSEHADFQANGMLALGRSLGRSPRELATTVAAALPADVAPTVAGPGFINLTLTDNALLTQAAGRLADPRLGVPSPDAGRVTVIDYSQPNIAKEMHVGHLRSTIIGDALARILTHLGGTVVRQNHIGDWGTQFGMLIEYMSTAPAAPASSAGISRLAGLYRDARAAFEADPGFADRSRRRVVALQAGDAETVAAWHDIVDESTRYFTDVYDRLGVLLEPGDVVGESFYNPLLAGVTEELLASGVAVLSDGAVCVFFDDVRGPDGEPVPLLVRKSDGGFGYAATDLAAVRHRVTALHADRVLYVVDARQALHFRMVFDTARRAGWIPADVTVTHVPFGLMLGSDGKPFRTRYGGTARLTDLVDDAVAGAREVARDPSLDAAVAEERARQVGIGALKYADLATNRARDYVYDPARMLSLTGNTSVYLQYAHVRARSILRKAGAGGEIDTGLPLEPAERELILDLDAFGDVVAEVGETLEPHRLCGYLFRLAQSFTSFFEKCPVLTAPSPVRENRLALCRLAAETMRAGLDLLGIASPDRL